MYFSPVTNLVHFLYVLRKSYPPIHNFLSVQRFDNLLQASAYGSLAYCGIYIVPNVWLVTSRAEEFESCQCLRIKKKQFCKLSHLNYIISKNVILKKLPLLLHLMLMPVLHQVHIRL